jgi:hypothetical protein
MKIPLLVILVAAAFGFAWPTFAQEQNAVSEDVRQQIEAVNMKLGEAQNKYDAAATAGFYAQNAVLVWQWAESGRPAVGQEAIEERYSLNFASKPPECSGELVQMYAIGDEISATWRFTCRSWNGYSVKIYVRDADTWKILIEYAMLENQITR